MDDDFCACQVCRERRLIQRHTPSAPIQAPALAYVLMCNGKPIRCYASAERAQQGLDLALEVGPPGPYYEVAVLKVE